MTTNRCKTWSFRVEQLFASIDHAYFLGTRNVKTRSVLLSRQPELKVISHTVWKEKLNATSSVKNDAHGGRRCKFYQTPQSEVRFECHLMLIIANNEVLYKRTQHLKIDINSFSCINYNKCLVTKIAIHELTIP